jgi:UDP-N-acetylmuramate: L-alanyl-gamma-D-glutamyl-meso-diaminopimelate ligase
MNTINKRVHFIAVGGAVMHNLALALQQKGLAVTGSDDEIYDPAKSRLENAGILPKQQGWFPEKITTDIDAIILGMHARADNPELLKAQEIGLKIYSFPEFVFEQSADKQRVVIAGSHGKTTITSMILHVLKEYNRSFDYLVGAQIEGFDLMVKLTEDAPVIIIEGDEYLSSALERRSKFLFYHPHIALISGVEWDHFNVFPTYESYVNSFEELANDLPKAGTLLFDETDDMAKVIAAHEREDINCTGYQAHPHTIVDGKYYLETANGNVELKVFGEHNMKNLNGAKLILNRLGITDAQFYDSIKKFAGAAKRLETLGENEHCLVLRDFAHAPSKVAATTKATKSLYPKRKLVACYELHTFSSLNKDFLPHYDEKLNDADEAVVFYSPHTLEMKKLPFISPDEIKMAFGRDDLQIFTETKELERFLSEKNWYESNLLLMSSGTFNGLNFNEFGQKILTLPVVQESPELTVIQPKEKKKKEWKGFLGKVFSGKKK